MMTSVYLFIICSIMLVFVSLLCPQYQTEESAACVWANPMDCFNEEGWSGFGNYKFLSILLLLCMVVVYIIFR